MPEITLVCSTHREIGLCNAVQLFRILRRLAPDVVFEERHPSAVHSRASLEGNALDMYRQYHVFKGVPVDRYDVPATSLATLRADIGSVFGCVEQASDEYRALRDEEDRNAYTYGFDYLNSPDSVATSKRLSSIEDEIISRTHDPRWIRALEEWRFVMRSRERDMVRNIYDYCTDNVFRSGVFLVGAAHKPGIMAEVARYAGSEAIPIAWKFTYDDQVVGGDM